MQTGDGPGMGEEMSVFLPRVKERVCLLVEDVFDEPHPSVSLRSVEIHVFLFH